MRFNMVGFTEAGGNFSIYIIDDRNGAYIIKRSAFCATPKRIPLVKTIDIR